jgi:hypothetical protein
MKRSIFSGFFLIFTAVALHPAMVAGQTPTASDPYVPLSVGEKAKVFGSRVIVPSAFAKSAFSAGIAQWRDSPHEWGQGMAGYGRRYGSRVGTRALENGIGFLTAAAVHEDPRYFFSGETGFWRRVHYAVETAVVTRTDSGNRTIALWRLSGNYGAQFVSNTWRPDRETHVSDTLIRGTISVGYDAASNVFKEFWPDIRRKVLRH